MELPIHRAAASAGRVLRLLTRNPQLLRRLSTTVKTIGNTNGDQLLKALEHAGTTPPQSISVDASGVTLYYSGVDSTGQRIGIHLTLALEDSL